jgi:Tfp pilus assembly PilM family ATPase
MIFRRNHYSPIGLDLGTRLIKALQLTGAGPNCRIQAALALPRNEGEAIDLGTTTRLRDILERHGFLGHRIVLAAPANQLHQEVLELPPRESGAPLDQIAAAEIARTGKMDPGSFEMASWDLPAPPRASAGTSVMALAMRHADAAALLDPFEHAGLDVIGIDSQACALARLLAARPTEGLSVVLDLGWNSGLVAFVNVPVRRHRGSR